MLLGLNYEYCIVPRWAISMFSLLVRCITPFWGFLTSVWRACWMSCMQKPGLPGMLAPLALRGGV